MNYRPVLGRPYLMEPLINGKSINDIEKTIQEIEGIQAARVVTNGDELEEIHVLSASSKNLKQLARDIESALMARHSFSIDYRKISIAQIDNGLKEGTDRPQLKAVNVEKSGSSVRVMVNIQSNGKEYEGVAHGLNSNTAKARLVAQATISALSKLDESLSTLGLEDVLITDVGKQKVAVACLNFLDKQKEYLYTGSALITNGTVDDAIVKAVLATTNRRIGFFNSKSNGQV